MTMTQQTGIRRELEAAPFGAAGASLRPVDWRSIEWKRGNRNVRHLQRRIVEAQQQGKKRKVRALQFILTRSYSARCLAVRRVVENPGRRTPGVDGQILDTPEKRAQAVGKLSAEDYQPQPLKRVYIAKKNGKGRRPLGIPTMEDRARQALHLLALDPIAETTADPNSYGFRKERSVADAIEQCFTLLARSNSPQWILEGDIQSCFDEISHEWLLSHIPMDRAILKKWLEARVIERESFSLTTTGTPQGGIISPVLMNLTLDGLESLLAKHFPPRRGNLVKLVRFADDFVITGRTKELLEEEVKPLTAEFLNPKGLKLSESKTRITHIEKGFDFLGKHFQKHGGKLLSKPSRQNVQAFLTEIKATFRENLHAPVDRLLMLLNPKIKGWAMFHRTSASKKAFSYADYRIFCELERWMQRRHPDKNLRWCYEKYLTQVGDRHYVLEGTTLDRRGKPRTIRLVKAIDVPIKRHVKIKAAANPYDPNWETYFEERLSLQMKENLRGYDKLLKLWYSQNGRCPQCGQKITPDTGWHLHHRVWVVNGGDDSIANLAVMHPICHMQLHGKTTVAESFGCCTVSSEEGV